MTNLGYTPTFDPFDWIDNADRIIGDGPRGFNVRFDAISSDLHQAAAVVSQINAELAQTVGGTTDRQLLTPGLDFVSVARGRWFYDKTGAVTPDTSTGAIGVMGLSLPANVRLVSLRAMGLYSGSSVTLSIALTRTPLIDARVTPQTLAEISSDTSALTNPYDVTVPVDVARGAVDTDNYRYCVVATVSAVPNGLGATTLATVQLAYTAS
ncbi:hypothetical protein [Streptomyces xylophagus]|uniref:hypothetical protein n=1 Tax=Streptomyces xylophagus TaxID=285514 RepID=UPI0005B81291|nr:hypothetical protein [Streptomyces xylophagus]